MLNQFITKVNDVCTIGIILQSYDSRRVGNKYDTKMSTRKVRKPYWKYGVYNFMEQKTPSETNIYVWSYCISNVAISYWIKGPIILRCAICCLNGWNQYSISQRHEQHNQSINMLMPFSGSKCILKGYGIEYLFLGKMEII